MLAANSSGRMKKSNLLKLFIDRPSNIFRHSYEVKGVKSLFTTFLIIMLMAFSAQSGSTQEKELSKTTATVVQEDNVNASEILSFENNQQRKIYESLILELRCPKCQNQNIADSNAEIAQDLRKKVYEMTLDNKTKSEIKDFMLARFGEFVLYKPQFTGKTILLWLLPIIVLLIVIGLMVKLIARNAKYLDSDTEQT